MTDPILEPARRHALLVKARLAIPELPEGWRAQVYEYGGGTLGHPGISLDLTAPGPAGVRIGRAHIVAWWKASQGFDYATEWALMVMEIENGNTVDPAYTIGETP